MRVFELDAPPVLPPRYNIAPTQPVPVVRVGREGRRELVHLRWGLVPYWAKDPAMGNRLINGRAETAAVRAAFRDPFRFRRCLVAADGFYEWQRTASGKRPYLVRLRDGAAFGFAGVWDRWRGPDGAALESCAILTTDANDLIRPIHDRMPAIVPRNAHEAWLEPSRRDPAEVAPLLRPLPSEAMTAYQVGTYVNSPDHDDPECVTPVTETGLWAEP